MSAKTILQIKNLDISFRTNAGVVHAIRGINLDLQKGETVAIVGATDTIFSPSTSTSAATTALPLTTRPPVKSRFIGKYLLNCSISLIIAPCFRHGYKNFLFFEKIR